MFVATGTGNFVSTETGVGKLFTGSHQQARDKRLNITSTKTQNNTYITGTTVTLTKLKEG